MGSLLGLYSDQQAARDALCRRHNDLIRRTDEHREGLVKGFTQRYGLKMLVHFEKYDAPSATIQREKNIKHWPRLWKLELVESGNPQWRDLYNDITR